MSTAPSSPRDRLATSVPVFGRVLVGFDGSESSRVALALASRLADPGDGELVLACVDEHRALRIRSHRRPAGEILAAGLACVPGRLKARGMERSASSAARGLCELAEDEHADLLVLGSHAGPEQRTSPGTTAFRLLQGAPCAIAIAPNGARDDDDRFHHIGVAYDGSAEARDALSLAYALAERDGAAVTVFRALPRMGVAYAGTGAAQVEAAQAQVRFAAQTELDEAADAAPPGVNPRTVLVHDEPVRIADECDGIVDLLTLGSRSYGPLHRVLAGSLSQAILLRATQPVLVVTRSGAAGGSHPQTASAPKAT